MPEMNSNNDRRGWHLEKSVSVSHIITTITFLVGAFVWASNVERRIDANTLTIKHQGDSVRDVKVSIQREFDEMNKKLDKLIDREMDR